jgi:uncharacterized coiled-coil protein SlyX
MVRGLVSLAVAGVAVFAQAQPHGELPCDEPHYAIVKKGQSLTVGCDFVLVLNDRQVAKITRQGETTGAMLKLLEARAQASDETIATQAQIISELKHLLAVEEASYQKLREQYQRADSLALAATRNTEEALSLAKRARYAGWFSSALVGGVAGGVAGLQRNESGGRAASLAAVGAVIGFGVSWLINH